MNVGDIKTVAQMVQRGNLGDIVQLLQQRSPGDLIELQMAGLDGADQLEY